MTEHIRSVHEGIKPYQCKLCGSAFHGKGHLRRHVEGNQDCGVFKREIIKLIIFILPETL